MSGKQMQTPIQVRQPLVVGLVVVLFFAWGFATVLIDTLIPKLKGLFELGSDAF